MCNVFSVRRPLFTCNFLLLLYHLLYHDSILQRLVFLVKCLICLTDLLMNERVYVRLGILRVVLITHKRIKTVNTQDFSDAMYKAVILSDAHMEFMSVNIADSIEHKIITFSERCTLKSVQVKSQDIHVINRYDVARVVSRICGQIPGECLSEPQIEELYNKLYSCTQVDEKTRAQHIANIESKLAPEPGSPVAETVKMESAEAKPMELTEAPESKQPQIPTCPRCGSRLVLRQAKRGANAGNQFYGCSSYPKCRYIWNLTENQ